MQTGAVCASVRVCLCGEDLREAGATRALMNEFI